MQKKKVLTKCFVKKKTFRTYSLRYRPKKRFFLIQEAKVR